MQWLEELAHQAHTCLTDRELEALWTRGVSESQIEKFNLGYLDEVLPDDIEYPERFLEWWSKQPRDDVFVFPLTNTLGHVLGIQLRHVAPERKGYTDFVATKEEPVYFGLHQAVQGMWDHEAVCMVEGTFDLFPIQRHLPFTISTLHAGIPSNLVRLLKRLVRKIWLAYDADYGGQKATKEIRFKHGKEFDVQVIEIPGEPYKNRRVKDPGELWEVWGDVRFGQHLERTGVIT